LHFFSTAESASPRGGLRTFGWCIQTLPAAGRHKSSRI
jgi:hypothetical protein